MRSSSQRLQHARLAPAADLRDPPGVDLELDRGGDDADFRRGVEHSVCDEPAVHRLLDRRPGDLAGQHDRTFLRIGLHAEGADLDAAVAEGDVRAGGAGHAHIDVGDEALDGFAHLCEPAHVLPADAAHHSVDVDAVDAAILDAGLHRLLPRAGVDRVGDRELDPDVGGGDCGGDRRGQLHLRSRLGVVVDHDRHGIGAEHCFGSRPEHAGIALRVGGHHDRLSRLHLEDLLAERPRGPRQLERVVFVSGLGNEREAHDSLRCSGRVAVVARAENDGENDHREEQRQDRRHGAERVDRR